MLLPFTLTETDLQHVMSLATRWLIALTFPLCSLASLAHGQAATPANTLSPLGMNISGLAYWSTEWPLLDEMKRGRFRWLTQCNRPMGGCDHLQAPASDWDTREQSLLDLDPNESQSPGELLPWYGIRSISKLHRPAFFRSPSLPS